jgi:diaminohydroxyphosphoribosylaminopyrimidine deaminase / 5-amino-6-(5-phosphoribosylamino)uracil reductase
MQRAEVTDAVWEAVLAARAGRRSAPDPDWPAAARAAWSLYAPLALDRRNAPYVYAQVGQSLDGRIATESGDARDVSGRDGLCHLHRCRALADAVIIGVRTAISDDPRLTVRLVRGANPARVVIDPKGRLPNEAAVLKPDGARRIVIQAGESRRPAGVEVITLPVSGDWISPMLIRKVLAARGLGRLLVEGGGITIAGFLEAGLLQRLHVCIAPLIIGAGPAGLRTSPVARLADALRPEMHVYGLDTDVVFDCALDPGGVASRSVWPTTQAAEVVAAKRA